MHQAKTATGNDACQGAGEKGGRCARSRAFRSSSGVWSDLHMAAPLCPIGRWALRRRRLAGVPWLSIGALGLLALALGTLQSVVEPALPLLQRELGVRPGEGALIGNALLVTGAVVTPVAGKLGDRYGGKRLLVRLMAVVSVGGLTAALAPNLPVLLIGQVLQGVRVGVAGRLPPGGPAAAAGPRGRWCLPVRAPARPCRTPPPRPSRGGPAPPGPAAARRAPPCAGPPLRHRRTGTTVRPAGRGRARCRS